MELDVVPFSLGTFVEELRYFWQDQMAEKGLEFEVRSEVGLETHLFGDLGRIRQVLLNLIGNARKFTNEGRITVEIKGESRPQNGLLLEFVVRDTGVGISAANQKRIFERFTQGDASTSRKFGGTGLGLAISKGLVELMGGEIGVTSRPGRGSTFWFTVQTTTLSGETQQSATVPAELGDIQWPKLTILVAEDIEINRQVIQMMLEPRGHTLVFALNGEEAIEACRSGEYDLVLMDIQMPVMDGIDATRKIRDLAGTMGAVPIIALTANAMSGDRERYLETGMNGYVSKPISKDKLERGIADVLGLDLKPAAQRHETAIAPAPSGETISSDSRILDELSASF